MRHPKTLSRRSFLAGTTSIAALAAPALHLSPLFAAGIANQSMFQTFKLSNGLDVHLMPNKSGVLSARVDLNYGAINEDVPGTAHLLEHVIFGNTERYSPRRIRDVSAKFRDIHAQVDLEWMTCTAGMFPDRLADYLSYTSDALFAPRFEDAHIAREKQSVLQEIVYRDTQIDEIKKMLYGTNHPLLYEFAGTRRSIDHISRRQLKDFHQAGFSPSIASLVMVGTMPANTEQLIETHFGRIKARAVTPRTVPAVPVLNKGKTVDQKIPQIAKDAVEIQLVWSTGVDLRHPDTYAMRALNHFLGSKVYYSRLRQKLAEERTLSYAVESSYAPTLYSSDFSVDATTKGDPYELLDAIFDVFDTMKSDPVESRLFPTFLDTWRYEKLAYMQMNHLMRDMHFDEMRTGISMAEEEAGYRAVTPQDIMRVADKYLLKRGDPRILVISRGA